MKRSSIAAGFAAILTILSFTSFAVANNNVTIQRFGTCTPGTDGNECASLALDEAGFRSFSSDLGLILAPMALSTAETIGEAGLAFQVDHSFHSVDSNATYWQLADADGTVASSQRTTQFHIRKGLPMSLEVGAMWTQLWDSDLAAAGAELQWAFHEDYYWPLPDVAIRGFASTMVGNRQLQLFLSGFDILVSEHIGVMDVMNISPFFGYNTNYVIASTRLIDATPGDLTPAEINHTSPEFSFTDKTEITSRWLAGVRFQVGIVDLTFQKTFSQDVSTFTTSIGLDF